MDYNSLKTDFKGYLNRNDCSDELADSFISRGIQRVDRLLKTPIQEHQIIFDVKASRESSNVWEGSLVIPPDYLGISNVVADDNRQVPRITMSQVGDGYEGYYVFNNRFHFEGWPAKADKLAIEYYSSMQSDDIQDDAITPATTSLDDIILFGALIYASIYYLDERHNQFSNMFDVLISEAQRMANEEEMDGLIISPVTGGKF